MHLYDMPGPVVGADNNRQVSDSALRLIQYLPDGSLLYHAWSDGGNSIMRNQPYSLYERAWDNKGGLRMSAAGAGVMTLSYLIRMDGDSYNISAATLWTSQWKGVQSTRILEFAAASDGSVLFTGRVTGQLSATPNAFPVVMPEDPKELAVYNPSGITGKPASGTNLTIINPAFNGLRFSTYMPGVAGVELKENGARLKSIIQKVGDRELALVVAGAQDNINAPFMNGIQKEFAGGHLDGHFTVIEMTPAKPRTDIPEGK